MKRINTCDFIYVAESKTGNDTELIRGTRYREQTVYASNFYSNANRNIKLEKTIRVREIMIDDVNGHQLRYVAINGKRYGVGRIDVIDGRWVSVDLTQLT